MKKILSIALVGLLPAARYLSGCGGEKKADPKLQATKPKLPSFMSAPPKTAATLWHMNWGVSMLRKTCPTFKQVTSNQFLKVPIPNV